jgi:hypothetical protein
MRTVHVDVGEVRCVCTQEPASKRYGMDPRGGPCACINQGTRMVSSGTYEAARCVLGTQARNIPSTEYSLLPLHVPLSCPPPFRRYLIHMTG